MPSSLDAVTTAVADFWSDFSASVFDPGRGLFTLTQEGLLYPNPASELLHGKHEHTKLFNYVGQILGKVGVMLFAFLATRPYFTELVYRTGRRMHATPCRETDGMHGRFPTEHNCSGIHQGAL